MRSQNHQEVGKAYRQFPGYLVIGIATAVLSFVDAFIKRYKAAGSTKSNDSLVDGAFDWFQHLDFNNVSWNL